MIRIGEKVSALWNRACSLLAAMVSSEGLYFVFMFLFNGILNTDVVITMDLEIELLRQYVMVPWTGALLALYLTRKERRKAPENVLLVILYLWMNVPFIYRFGVEYDTMYTLIDYASCFFVLYTSVCGSDAKRRARQLDIACAGVCLIAIVLGAALLYCATTGAVYQVYEYSGAFGVVNGQLQHAAHYNITGMYALSSMMLCMVGLCRSKNKVVMLYYGAGVVLMALVIVLTQSRTARYAMLGALAVGTWNALADRLSGKRRLLRQSAALFCGAAVLVGGYLLCAQITDAALAHYMGEPSSVVDTIVPAAIAEEGAQQETQALQARAAVDSTFSDRTNIWKNVFKNWKNTPKYMFIGNGAGRTKWLVAEGTIHESMGEVSVHNAYLQFAADFGLIGFALLAAAMLLMAMPSLQAFFARGEKRMPGGCALGMAVIAALATGMMESPPLEAMTPINMTLFFALAQLAAAGRALKANA